MLIYSKKLIKKKKLIKFWLFFHGSLQSTIKNNYAFLSHIYKKNTFINSNILIANLKKLVPLFLSTSKTKGEYVFVSRASLYVKTIFSYKDFGAGKEIAFVRPGVFSNFGATACRNFVNLNFKINPAIIIFLSLYKNGNPIREAKLRNLPTIALTSNSDNSRLIDYPIVSNSRYFYTVYFFNKLLFKMILQSKD